MKFSTAEQITDHFIKDGWSKSTSFTELSLKEAEEKGYHFAINGINNGRKYFKMNVSENIYIMTMEKLHYIILSVVNKEN
jgi:hypothetical protein